MTKYLEGQLSQRIGSLASVAALHLSGDYIDGLLIDDLSIYAETLEFIDSLAQIDSLSEISIIDLDYSYLVSTHPDNLINEKYLLAQLNKEYLQKAASGSAATSQLYDIDGTYLKSAYGPLLDSHGMVNAILVVEAGAGYYDLLSTLRKNLIVFAGGSAAIAILLLIFYIIYGRRIAAAEEKLFKAGSQAILGRMVAVVSHEIKNPLMILRAAGERLEKKYDDDEASYIIEEVSRLDAIVNGYLSFAKGERSLTPEKVATAEFFNKIITSINSQFTQKEITLNVKIEDDISDIEVDKIGIRQVMLNLLLNAIQSVENLEETCKKQVTFEIKQENKKIIIRISDNGSGIKPGNREKLFEPFFTTRTQGSGLGLYLSRQIINMHKGSIKFIDYLPQITTLEIILPAGDKQ